MRAREAGADAGSATGRVGVMLVNLGTPDAPDAGAVRRYLAQFLSDRRVVELPPLLWQPILRLFVLTTRPRRSAAAYREIWTDKGSPLASISAAQAADLAGRLGEAVMVRQAMRYGDPAIGAVLADMMAAGCDRLLVAPLYPQYCAATTATAIDALYAELKRLRAQPTIRTLPPYADDPAYIAALAARVRAEIAALDFTPERLIASFHGMPQRTADLGDPYYSQCLTTGRLLAQALDRPVDIAFQSRFGAARWLQPATDATLARMGTEGVRRVAVVAPGFSVDCLETLEELAIRGRDQFIAAGGEQFAYLPCLNDTAEGMDMLETLVRRELSGWTDRDA